MLERKDLQVISDIIRPESKVLDLGCGDGKLLNELIKEKNIKGLGIEISIKKIKACLEKGISVLQEDLNEGLKDFQENSFDYVVLSQTLEYVSKPLNLLKEMLRIGNCCIISFENLAYWKNRVSFLFTGSIQKTKGKKLFTKGGKKQFLTIKNFLKLCEIYEFIIVKRIFLPKKRLNLAKIFPNVFSRASIFILKANKPE
jgi:methionine biosynthesis protein MetW